MSLEDKDFLDIGSGSGLFSLVAHNCRAKVYSFDYDKISVICTKKLKESMLNEGDKSWHVVQGDVLDCTYMKKFYGKYDIVYSWGVLHHTGNMWKALKVAAKCVRPGGYLFIGIYKDCGIVSRIWKVVKQKYNVVSEKQKKLILFLSSLYMYGYRETCLLYKEKQKIAVGERAKNKWNDLIDWVGGYPFEYATADEIITLYLKRGFQLVKFEGSSGFNQFLFVRK